jgi:uridine kinase
MLESKVLTNPDLFSEALYEKMVRINPGVAALVGYEFRDGLNNFHPADGWDSVDLDTREIIAQRLKDRGYYESIQLKPRVDGRIVLDSKILHLTRMLFAGLVCGKYSVEWVRPLFYFDLRGFYFLPRTEYFSDAVLAYFGGRPFQSFQPKQRAFELQQSIGYPEFQAANADLDELFIKSVMRLIAIKGTPVILGIAGPTAAGKTEIVARLFEAFERAGQKTTSIEMDNFLTDRDQREEQGIDSLGEKAIHFELFRRNLAEIIRGKRISIPRYDFISGNSSHNLDGSLKPGCTPIEIEPADIIFIEGNFPFLLKEIHPLIGIKVVYLTDDPVRLKRKWRRDMDYRKKYDLNYFRNRYFKDQFLMAQQCFLPQMLACDLLVDTSGARLWAPPEIAEVLKKA